MADEKILDNTVVEDTASTADSNSTVVKSTKRATTAKATTAKATTAKATAAKATTAKSGAKSATAKASTAKATTAKSGTKASSAKSTTAKSTAAKSGTKASGSKSTAKKTTAKKTVKKPSKRFSLDDDFGLKLFFQPIFLPSEDRVYGYECLLRIVDKDLGTITPDMFLGVAKKNPVLMRGLEEWSIGELFRTARLFREHKRFINMLSINIDTDHFCRSDFFDKISKYIEKIVDNIYLELKEDVFFSTDPVVIDNIKRLRTAGIKIAVDDFSASFLTFPWNEDLPFDMIKIERTYIDRFMTSPKAKLIVEKIIQFGLEHHLEMVAVGIENAEQEKALSDLGCDKMQGYYYSKPLQVKRLLSDKGGK